jgi:peptidoglycan/xylan/chitin deacetylase (PgdA/CDA1 family)
VSVWTYGFPLLQRYQFPAVVFLIPGYIREDDLVSPTLEDVCAGRCSPSKVRSRDPEFMSWAEIEIMARSGLVDFQSHTLYHHPVPISPKIVDYVNPRTTQILYSLPVESGRESQLKQVGIAGLYGSPIYENAR